MGKLIVFDGTKNEMKFQPVGSNYFFKLRNISCVLLFFCFARILYCNLVHEIGHFHVKDSTEEMNYFGLDRFNDNRYQSNMCVVLEITDYSFRFEVELVLRQSPCSPLFYVKLKELFWCKSRICLSLPLIQPVYALYGQIL